MSRREQSRKRTALAWTSKGIKVAYVTGTCDEACEKAQAMLATLTREKDNPCWQVIDGWAPTIFDNAEMRSVVQA